MSEEKALSLQDQYAPGNQCFGCGPSNPKGLQIKSFPDGDEVVCHFKPAPHHLAFGKVLNGGICGTLLDCHSNWTAAHAFMKALGQDQPPCTVTAKYSVILKRPTPLDTTLCIRAHAVEVDGNRAVVEAAIEAGGKVTATCRGTFIAVTEGHPAYHRW